MQFTTDRLIAKHLTILDVNGYYDIFSANDVSEFDEFEPITLEDAASDIDEIISKYAQEKSEENELGVYLKGESDLLGVLYFKFEDEHILIGYHFNGKFRGKGFAREAVQGLITYLETTQNKQILAKVDSENERSIHLLEKLGFTRNSSYAEQQFFKGKNRIEWLFSK
jgi:RimJ/RimL family protein N-acetyltransferase